MKIWNSVGNNQSDISLHKYTEKNNEFEKLYLTFSKVVTYGQVGDYLILKVV